MFLVAQNNLEFILEIAIIMQIGIVLFFNILKMSLSRVLSFSLILGIGLTLLFSMDALGLFISALGFHEFTHTYGPIALMVIVTSLAALPMMQNVGIKVRNLRGFIYLLMIIITIVGGLMHRDFLMLWLMGLFIGFLLISKSFRQKSFLTAKRVIAAIVIVALAFGSLESISRLLSMSVLSPMVRIERILGNGVPSLQMVIPNTTWFGHTIGSSYWGSADLGSSSGYIALPISFILAFGLPLQVFFGVLSTKKDVIDYFLPGIYAVGFDFGYVALVLLLIWCVFVIVLGLKILTIYREKREKGNKRLLGREALLIGSLTAFAAQAILGLFIQNRGINGTAMITFMFLSGMVLAHALIVKKS